MWYQKPLTGKLLMKALLVFGAAVLISLAVRACRGDEYASCAEWLSWSSAHRSTYTYSHLHSPAWMAETNAFCVGSPDSPSFLAR